MAPPPAPTLATLSYTAVSRSWRRSCWLVWVHCSPTPTSWHWLIKS